MIIVNHRGRLGNKMFQVMLAEELRRRTGGAIPVGGIDLPEFGLSSPPFRAPTGVQVVLKRHVFQLDRLAYLLRAGLIGSVVIDGWGMRLENFGGPGSMRPLFKSRVAAPHRLSGNEILIHVRLQDIASGQHPKYFPMALSFYQRIIDETGLTPVFMGQLENGPYVEALKTKFKGARFLAEADIMEDFEQIRSARNVVLSVSSFSWLASWLSEACECVHLPIAGLLDPRNGETMLLPVGDKRYHFYEVPFPAMGERPDVPLVEWAKSAEGVRKLNRHEAGLLVLKCYKRTLLT